MDDARSGEPGLEVTEGELFFFVHRKSNMKSTRYFACFNAHHRNRIERYCFIISRLELACHISKTANTHDMCEKS
jgi:hypothetical protein